MLKVFRRVTIMSPFVTPSWGNGEEDGKSKEVRIIQS